MGVSAGQAFAQYTIGHECDVRVSTLEGIRLKKGFSPPDGATAPVEPGATAPGEPSNEIITLAMGHGDDATANLFPWDYFLDDVTAAGVDPLAEVIYWERPDGGRVFNGGAIANGVALYYNDTVFVGLVRNVLNKFLDS